MEQSIASAIYLKDYIVPAFLVESVYLVFQLNEDVTHVTATLEIYRNIDYTGIENDIWLNGDDLTLQSLMLDEKVLSEQAYSQNKEGLCIYNVPEHFTLTLTTLLHPQDNTSLEGLYKSKGMFCTQCEAQGFRKITYFLDQPDIMARYTTKIIADKQRYPCLLSNGNLLEKGDLEEGKHYVIWQDPFKKPSYLFALVAGDLVDIQDTYTTISGKTVSLHLYVEEKNKDKCQFAMQSLQRAMAWDEQVYNLEYDLDTYMIVAVEDFNMGAMENKGLNIFNAKYVLASSKTATDKDFEYIEGIIGHEYFHNWTGDRVTRRDWAQLRLKGGLPEQRDQEFSADMGSRAVKRIADVQILRSHQFAEDASPIAHPVRPASYMEINNFYTVTVYNKGAEVVRMIHTLLGKEGFKAGMDLYFQRHDGKAVTTDDFVQAMQDANAFDLSQFRLWYSQAGTPRVTVQESYDRRMQEYTLDITQYCPTTPELAEKEPFIIPLKLALLDKEGKAFPLQLADHTEQLLHGDVLMLNAAQQPFTFKGISEKPVLSLLRNFSAPVIIEMPRDASELAFLMAYDDDDFNRWDAGQQLAVKVILLQAKAYREDHEMSLNDSLSQGLLNAFARILENKDLDKGLAAKALTLPGEDYLLEQMEIADIDAIHSAREFVRWRLAEMLEDQFRKVYLANSSIGGYVFDAKENAQRSLKNICLSYLVAVGGSPNIAICFKQFEQADNMTDNIHALNLLAQVDCVQQEKALATFEKRWGSDTLVMDKWFMAQALSPLPGTLEKVKQLMQHPLFTLKNPNKVRSVLGAFSQNLWCFHDISGASYQFIADQIIALDSINPQVAARLVKSLSRWKRYDKQRQILMKAELQRIVKITDLSKDVYEIVVKSLE